MIGNTIKYRHSEIVGNEVKHEEREGLVVDAFTSVHGSVSGRSESFLGFGSGSASGSTNSNRMYKVQYWHSWDTERKLTRFQDIRACALVSIVKFAAQPNQERDEEQIKINS